MCYHLTEDRIESYRMDAKMERGTRLRYDLHRHQLGECGISCGYCAEEDSPKVDPCENCGEDMGEGRHKTDLGWYCDTCHAEA